MIGIGAANVAAGFFQGFPVSTSGSRTAVAEQSGAGTLAHRRGRSKVRSSSCSCSSPGSCAISHSPRSPRVVIAAVALAG